MREIRLYGSEGGVPRQRGIPTPIKGFEQDARTTGRGAESNREDECSKSKSGSNSASRWTIEGTQARHAGDHLFGEGEVISIPIPISIWIPSYPPAGRAP